MCGIAGILNLDISDNDFDIINKSILNRGPDGQASLIVDEFNLKLFHTRLAITDFTKNGQQPFVSENSKYIIVFNGEIYNYKDIKIKLVNENIIFKSLSDTEVLLEAISNWGFDKAIKTAHGMFTFCLLDKEKKKLILVRDSFGEKHLFYYFKNNQLIFSSEISTINNLIKNKISQKSINKLLKYSYIESPSSIYNNVNKLEPGQILEFDLGITNIKYSSKLYYDNKEIFNNLPKDEKYSDIQLKKVLRKSIDNISKDYEKKIGIFLSSGIDSSLIFTEMAKNNNNLKTYTIGFENEENEIEEAEKISNKFKIENKNKILTEDDIIENLKIIHKVYKEPLCDPSCIPMISLCRLASKDVKVAISGDASDEIFGGYNRYKLYKKILKLSELGSLVFNNDHLMRLLSILGFRNDNLINFSKNILNKKFNKAYDIIMRNNYGEGNELFLETEVKYNSDKFINTIDKSLIPNFCDINSYLPDNIFQKTDKASMYFGLEVRTPFTNLALVNLGLSHYKNSNYKNNKKPLLDLLKENYEEYKKKKIKKGFGIPKFFFKRKKIFDFLLQNINESKSLKDFVDINLINKIVYGYKNEPEKNFQKFFTISILSLWLNNK